MLQIFPVEIINFETTAEEGNTLVHNLMGSGLQFKVEGPQNEV